MNTKELLRNLIAWCEHQYEIHDEPGRFAYGHMRNHLEEIMRRLELGIMRCCKNKSCWCYGQYMEAKWCRMCGHRTKKVKAK